MTFTIQEFDSNQRIDKFLKRVLSDAPISFIYKMFRQKDIKVNSKKAEISYILNEGDIVDIYLKDDLYNKFKSNSILKPVKKEFDIIYEDENILVVDKPRGLLVHGDCDEKRVTLQNMVLNYLKDKKEYDESSSISFTPSPAHRLDRNTSGIVIFGKNLPTLQELLSLFRERNDIVKKYSLLVRGITDTSGTINLPLLKDPNTKLVKVVSESKGGKKAITEYKRIKSYNSGYSLVEAELKTGRTHQLRVHFQSISHPIVGDPKYGDFKVNKEFEKLYGLKNQFLHAGYFKFKNIKGKLEYLSNKEFISPLPEKLNSILKELSKIS